jgi:general secretion pathway protein G
MKAKHGFTLVEILIVVVILGILAAIVIPQFTEASTEAKNSSLVSSLQTMRSQIELFKIQHNDNLPGWQGATFEQALTGYTDQDGTIVAQGAVGAKGPYMQKIPANPFLDGVLAETVTKGTAVAPGDDSSGWYFNTDTGQFNANDSGTLKDALSTPHKTL